MKIINPNEIGSKISTLISESQEKFCAVTPYLDLSKWKKILINLENAVKRNIKITFYFREIRDKDFNVLKALGIELIKIDGLHTKLYFNESEVIVSSMNLYEFSDLYSIDIAMYFNELEEYNKIYNYFVKYIASKNNKNFISDNHINKLDTLHNQLSERYSKTTINKSSDYIFTKNLVPIFHLFIKLDGITIKYPRKDYTEKLINELENKIKAVLKYEIERDGSTINNFYWKVKIRNNDFLKSSNIISELKKIETPKSIDKSIKLNIDNSLKNLYSNLKEIYTKTNFEDETIYINDISKEVKAFIQLDSITIRFERNYVTKKFIYQLDKNIKSALNYEVLFDEPDFKKFNNLFYWRVNLKNPNTANLIDIISDLKKVEIPNSLIRSTPF